MDVRPERAECVLAERELMWAGLGRATNRGWKRTPTQRNIRWSGMNGPEWVQLVDAYWHRWNKETRVGHWCRANSEAGDKILAVWANSTEGGLVES